MHTIFSVTAYSPTPSLLCRVSEGSTLNQSHTHTLVRPSALVNTHTMDERGPTKFGIQHINRCLCVSEDCLCAAGSKIHPASTCNRYIHYIMYAVFLPSYAQDRWTRSAPMKLQLFFIRISLSLGCHSSVQMCVCMESWLTLAHAYLHTTCMQPCLESYFCIVALYSPGNKILQRHHLRHFHITVECLWNKKNFKE